MLVRSLRSLKQRWKVVVFVKVRVRMDITIPLSRGRMVSLEQGKELQVSFKYERLPNICYWCDCLNHDNRDCEAWLESEGSLKVEDQQFGPWLRAAPASRARKNTVTVPGLFKTMKGSTSTPKALTLIPPKKVSNPIITFTESFHQDSFLFKLVEIDEGLSKLNVMSTLNSEVTRKVHSIHVINEEVKETARVCQGQGSKNRATLWVEAIGKQEKKFSQ